MADWLSILFRSFLFFIVLFLLTKALGKKQLTHLTFFEYVSGITIGSIAAAVSMDLESNISHGLLSLAVWTLVPLGLSFLSQKNKKVRDIVEGKGTVLIKDGKILEDNLKKEKYTIDELMTQLRQKNYFHARDVEFAVLEPSGSVSVLPKKEKQPLTAKDIDLKVQNEKEPQTVIMDGEILDEPLATLGYNRDWLKNELEKQGAAQENVFFAQVDSSGNLTVDLYDDKLQVPSPKRKPLVLHTLRKCQADLETFALQTESEEARSLYKKNAQELQNVRRCR